MNMTFAAAAAVAGGGAIGALARWMLNIAFGEAGSPIPLGTLAANLVGGLLMGITIGVLDQFDTLPVPVRLAITTGFLGGLTTFSTFSGETVTFMLRQQWGLTVAIVTLHVVGSVLATLLGVALVRLLLRA